MFYNFNRSVPYASCVALFSVSVMLTEAGATFDNFLSAFVVVREK